MKGITKRKLLPTNVYCKRIELIKNYVMDFETNESVLISSSLELKKNGIEKELPNVSPWIQKFI